MRFRGEDLESPLTAKSPNRNFAHRPAHHHPKSKTVLPSSPQCFNGKANSLARSNIFFDGELRTPVPFRQAFEAALRRPARAAAANRLRTLFISPPGLVCISSILGMVNTPGPPSGPSEGASQWNLRNPQFPHPPQNPLRRLLPPHRCQQRRSSPPCCAPRRKSAI